MKDIRQNNINRPILGQLNINSIRNKFSFLASQIGNNLDVLLISETKLDDTFPTAQFLLDGFKKPYRLDYPPPPPDNPSCIDLLLTNRPRCFQNTVAVETGISDFHKMVVMVFKVFYKKQKPKIIQYRK